MTGIWGARCDMTCEMWDVMGLRCELILANLGKHSHHNISHIRKLLTLLHKYITHIKYHLAKISNLTKTDNNAELRVWQICGLLLLRPGHVWGSGVRRESAMSLIRSSSKRMKRATERERCSSTSSFWLKIRFFVKFNLSESRLRDGQFRWAFVLMPPYLRWQKIKGKI